MPLQQTVENWKDALYQAYVSSGQAGDSGQCAEKQFAPRKKYMDAVIGRHFPADRNARVLDVGCGHGALMYFLGRHGYKNAVGVDDSEEQVELAARLGVSGVSRADGLEFLRAAETASADVICLFDVMEHLTRQEMWELVKEVRRVLGGRGMCIGHVPNAGGIFGMAVRYGDLTHEQAFTAASLAQVFGCLGYGVDCYEDKPSLHGVLSAARRLIWEAGTAPIRLLRAAEKGTFQHILSDNLLFVAKPKEQSQRDWRS